MLLLSCGCGSLQPNITEETSALPADSGQQSLGGKLILKRQLSHRKHKIMAGTAIPSDTCQTHGSPVDMLATRHWST